MLVIPCYFIKILVSCQSTDGLTLCILREMKFSLLLYLNNHGLLRILCFFYWKKIQLFQSSCICNKKAVLHWNTLAHTIVYCFYHAYDMTLCIATLIYTLHSNHISPLCKCYLVSYQVSFCEDPVAFVFS